MSKISPIIKIITISLLASIIYVLFIFSNVAKNEFLLIHDHLVWFNPQHLINESFLRTKDNGGLQYGLWSSMSVPNRVVYSALFSLGLSLRTSEMVFFTLIFTLLISLSYLGFYRLNYVLFDEEHYYSLPLVVGVVYFLFNSHISHNINTGNFFNIGFVLAYVSLPHLIYYLVSSIKNGWDYRYLFGLLIWVFFSINYLVYFVPIVLTAASFLFLYSTTREIFSIPLKKLIVLVLIGCSLLLNIVYGFLINQASSKVNATYAAVSGSTDGMIKDGLLTMLFQRFSWAMYVDWLPKSILSFSEFYFSPAYLVSIFIIIALPLVALKVCKDSKIKKILIVMFVLYLLNTFLAKGSSEPLGFIYRYLVTYFPPFLTVRSPDNKFSVGVVFALTEMLYISLLYIKTKTNLRYTAVSFLLVIISLAIISTPIINLKAVLGEDIVNKSGKFITHIPKEYLEIINIINKDPYYSNVLIYPSSTLPNLIHDGKIFIGKDPLGTMSNKPFYYLSYADLTDKDLLSKIKDVFRDPTMIRINELGIKYIIYRKDAYMDGHDIYGNFQEKIENPSLTSILIENKYLVLYEVKKPVYPSFANCEGFVACSTRYISPVEQVVEIPYGVESITIEEDLIKNKYWSLTQLRSGEIVNKNRNIFSYIFGIEDNDEEIKLDKNIYTEPVKVDKEPNEALYLRIYFTPQKAFYITAIISYLVLSYLILFIFIKRARGKG